MIRCLTAALAKILLGGSCMKTSDTKSHYLQGNGWKLDNCLHTEWDSDDYISNVRMQVALLKRGVDARPVFRRDVASVKK